MVQSSNNLILLLLGILVAIALGFVMHLLASILLPLIIALLLSNLFSPIMLYFKKRKFPAFIGLLMVLLVFGLMVSVLGLLIYSSIASFVDGIRIYQPKLTQLVVDMEYQLRQILGNFDMRIEDIPWQDALSVSSVADSVTSGVGSFLHFLTNTFIVILYMMFILATSGQLTQKVKSAFQPGYANAMAGLIENIDKQVRQYLFVKTLMSLLMGIVTSVILWLIGLDFPIMWGFIAFLLNYIPNVGGTIATALPVILAILQFDNWVQPILVLTLPLAAHMIIGNVLEPRIMANSLDLSAVLVLISLIFWGWLWGIGGMILAVPLTATIKIIFENIVPLHPLSILMSGEIPLKEEVLDKIEEQLEPISLKS